MRTNLSPTFVARAKAEPGAGRTIYWDEALAGFGLQVTAAGAKSFVCQYRANGISRRIAIKATLKLGEARKEARAILGRVAKGGDPLTERRKVTAAAEDTLEKICETYFKREGKRLRTMDERERVLKRLVFPKFGSRQIGDIRRSEIARLLDHIEDTSGAVMADRTLAYLRKVMNWHAGRTDEFRTPIVRGMARTRPAELARDRVLTDAEIKAVWKAAGEMQNAFGPFIRFLLLTAARKTEASDMRRDEIDGNLWTIPAARNKGKAEEIKPLSKAAKAIIDGVPVINDGEFVFTHDGVTAIGGFSKFKEAIDKASGVTGWRIHDLRRTARSLMSRAGVEADIGERCLGHTVNGVRGVYDRHEYTEEKRAAFDTLAKEIERIIGPGKVRRVA
jgi:integrase